MYAVTELAKTAAVSWTYEKERAPAMHIAQLLFKFNCGSLFNSIAKTCLIQLQTWKAVIC